VHNTQRTGVRLSSDFSELLTANGRHLREELFRQMGNLLYHSEATVPTQLLLDEGGMAAVAKQIGLLATNYSDTVFSQIRQVVRTRGTGQLKLTDVNTKTFGVGVTLERELVSKVNLRQIEPFMPKANNNGYAPHPVHQWYEINTGLPLCDITKGRYRLGCPGDLLNTKASNFWTRLTSLVSPDSSALQIPPDMLIYPPLTGKNLGLLKRTAGSLNQASLNVEQISQIREGTIQDIKNVRKQVGL
jgi:hypothetical protein